MGTDKALKWRDVQLLLIGCMSLGYVTFQVLNVVYSNQPTPYIDEIFHIPQAKLYCNNRWTEWDPKITTLPGLYILSYVILKPLEKFIFEDVCSVYGLRLTNVIATLLNFILSYLIIKKLQLSTGEDNYHRFINFLSAFNIAILPPLYFFTFLYYTDVWSLTLVLLMYQQHLHDTQLSRSIAGVIGLLAILMRQTNVIWVGFLLIDSAWCALAKHFAYGKPKDYKHTVGILNVLATYLPFSKARRQKHDTALRLIMLIVKTTLPYVMVCCAFITFIILNGGIVLGDKQAHTAVFHPMQNLYFVNFAAFFGLPFILTEVYIMRKKFPKIFILALFCGLCAILSEVNKLEHPYLLADNRHLAFYVWKKIFGHRIVRRLIIPTYVVHVVLLYRLLKNCHPIFMFALALSIILNLTPQYLFELRYFIIPFVMCRLHFNRQVPVVLETFFFVTINALTIHLFLSRPFIWSSEPDSLQRFIW